MTVCALTLAVLAVCAGIIVETFKPVRATATPDEAPPVISLNPNLSKEANFGSEKDDEVVYCVTSGDYSYVFSQSQKGSSAFVINERLELVSEKNFDERMISASLCEGGFIVTLETDKGVVVAWLDGFLTELTRSDPYSTSPVAIYSYEDGQAVLFYTETESNGTFAFRFYRGGMLALERYVSSIYSLSPVECYRIGNQFILFFKNRSDFTSGGGYVMLSFNAISTPVTYFDLREKYELLDVIPQNKSFSLLISTENQTSVLTLDDSLNRHHSLVISECKSTDGRLFYDGTRYYCLICNDQASKAYSFTPGENSLSPLPPSFCSAEIVDEKNVNGKIVALLRGRNDEAIVYSLGELFSLRVTGTGCKISALLPVKSGLAIVGSGALSKTTLTPVGGNDLFVGLLA